MLLEVSEIDIAYREQPVVRDVSFRLEQGGLGCLLGPSGCGKTTLLRAIAGFEQIQKGAIRLADEVVSRRGWTQTPERRNTGMVFQDFALFPHLSIADNIAFGLRNWGAGERKRRIAHLLALVGMQEYHKAYPHQLSGGQQQRIALARALAPRPRLLLLDEPFSSLDVELREELAREVRTILKQEGITAILVTHDQYEAFAMADEIGVMNDGQVIQWGSGYKLYHQPADRFVADFIGQGVFLPGRVLNPNQVETEIGILDGQIPTHCRAGCEVEVLLRPDDIVDGGDGSITGEVMGKAFRGADFLYTLRLPSGAKLLCLTHSHNDYAIGERLAIRPDLTHVVTFPRSSPSTE